MSLVLHTLDRELRLRSIGQIWSLLKSAAKGIVGCVTGLADAIEMQQKVDEGKDIKTAFKSVYGIDLRRS